MAESASKKAVINEINGISKCYPIANETNDNTSVSYILFETLLFLRFALITANYTYIFHLIENCCNGRC